MALRKMIAFVTVLVLGVLFPALAEGPVLVVSSTCSGNGFTGTISKDGVQTGFTSCSTLSTIHTEIRDSSGTLIAELDVDEVLESLIVKVDGIVLDGNITEQDAAHIVAFLNTPEAALVDDGLWSQLQLETGSKPTSRPLAGIEAMAIVFEWATPPPPEPLDECFGCCGRGCKGCKGCYTDACLAHDTCVALWGDGHPVCAGLFHFAAISTLCCRGIDLGPLC